MPINQSELQTKIIELLADEKKSKRLGGGRWYFFKDIEKQYEKGEKPNRSKIMSAIWSLLGQGLVYIDFSEPSTENWSLNLTEEGWATAKDNEVNPNSPDNYFKRFNEMVPNVSDIIFQYTRESVFSYNTRCYLACLVMIGVASEAAIIELSNSIGNWLKDTQGKEKFLETINSKRANITTKFETLRKKIEALKSEMPSDLINGIELKLSGVMDLLRENRNDAGHPTGRKITRDDAFISLILFPRYLQRIYELKDFFNKNRT